MRLAFREIRSSHHANRWVGGQKNRRARSFFRREKEKLNEITADVQREIDEDSDWAESSPMPEPEGAVYGVFDNSIVPPAFRSKILEN